jgi:SAM-dependent methyltransferase
MLKRFIAGKFRNPTGLSGRLVGSLMAHGNRRAVDWTVSVLRIQPADAVLEVGFGPGVAIERLVREASQGSVAGIDSSPTMVDVARRRNAAAIGAGRVELKVGDAGSLPYANQVFDKVFSIHCIYFWTTPVRVLKELRRVLRPGGIAAATILPRRRWLERKTEPPADLFTLYEADDVALLLERAGFDEVRVEDGLQEGTSPCVCVIGRKPRAAATGRSRDLLVRPVVPA